MIDDEDLPERRDPERREPERRHLDYQLERRIDKLDGKIDRVQQEVENSGEAMRGTLENLSKLIDERWKSMEQRFDLTGRQQQQSIELLSETAKRQEQQRSAMETELSLMESDLKVEQTKREQLDNRINSIGSNLAKLAWLVVGGLLTFIGSVGVYLVTH
jgi:chromosome segregation ATPase